VKRYPHVPVSRFLPRSFARTELTFGRAKSIVYARLSRCLFNGKYFIHVYINIMSSLTGIASSPNVIKSCVLLRTIIPINMIVFN